MSAPCRRQPGGSPISSGAVARRIPRRGNLGPSLFCARAVGGLRTYAADATTDATEDIAGEENDEAQLTPPPTHEKPEKSRGAPRKRDSLLHELAKEGTSPKFREDRKQEQREWSNFSLNEIKRAETAANKEVIWLTDRATLAERVEKVLQKRDALFAATLVRKAQRLGLGSTAAWNYLMEYCMRENEPQAAWRFYNEMKKRGRQPNTRTYTLMLSGLGRTASQLGFNNIKTALSIYESIAEANNGIEQSIVHANALLTACLRQGDLDTLWKVAADLPEVGPQAPDEKTYTIILKAVTYSLERDVKEIPSEDVDKIIERRHEAVIEAKKVWSEVVYLWKAGRIPMDTYLANAMAKILLQGTSDHDCHDVFKLYRQVCGTPVLVEEPRKPRAPTPPSPPPRSSSPPKPKRKQKKEEHLIAPDSDPDMNYVPFVGEDEEPLYKSREAEEELEEVMEQEPEEEVPVNFDHLFDPVFSEVAPAAEQATNAEETQPVAQDAEGTSSEETSSTAESTAETPQAVETNVVTSGREVKKPSFRTLVPFGNPELCYVLEACMLMTQGTPAARANWEYFTQSDNPHKIQPDKESCLWYLRILRQSHSSRLTIRLLQDQMIPAKLVDGRIFHIALSCCRRDRKNISIFRNANEILDLMHRNIVLPDPRALEGYLELVESLRRNPQRLTILQGLEPEREEPAASLEAWGRELQVKLQLLAVQALRPHIAKFHDAMQQADNDLRAQGRSSKNRKDVAVYGSSAVKIMLTARLMMDNLLTRSNASLISEEDRKLLEEGSHRLRVYSTPGASKKFHNITVFPTPKQLRAFENGGGRAVVGEIAKRGWRHDGE
ncbi:hypothetical protein SI65_08033 [Aspergillus cristatus]|uniref:Pentatricopeptide repeat protein n=1 Tax=Aspergillus cristatus TaxID=573508 RepID=A0A1E3B800_ASPCR|nr:hypothetical protein SI65_08033 [Aspergillus cristatus]